MANIQVDVLVTAQGVAARENYKAANRSDTVTWSFRPNNRIFRIEFSRFLPPRVPLSSQPEVLQRNPFTSPLLPSSGGTISGTIDPNLLDGLYLYEIFEGDRLLTWLNPISVGQNFGGVEIPDPPQSRP